jgi:uncharacterized protein (TIGR02421 family)
MALLRDLEQITYLDRELVAIIQDFHILQPLSWPLETQQLFLAEAKKGNYILPEVTYAKQDCYDKIHVLRAYIKKLGKDDHPAVCFLRDTAESYLVAHYILQGIGTEAVSEYSAILYGSPKQKVGGYKRSNIDVAKYFLRVVDQYQATVRDEPLIYSAEEFRRLLQERVWEWIDPERDPVQITLDDKIAARAASGSNYVKIRRDARFSEVDLLQMLHHEVFTHTLTYINGRKQPVLSCMGYSSPRITATQEGLAVFAEYINLSIELVRLKRIALRIVALDMAGKGANLIDLYQFFKQNGQNAEESYYSAMRTFRGGFPKGGVVFYKDNVYIRGLIEVEGFLKQAMHLGLVHDIAILFAGKLTTGDVIRMNPLIEQGYIIPPSYMPKWASRSGELAAHLAFNDITERFKLDSKTKKG